MFTIRKVTAIISTVPMIALLSTSALMGAGYVPDLSKQAFTTDDPDGAKGADWRDLVMDGAGIVCGNLICGVSFNHNKQPMASVTFKLN